MHRTQTHQLCMMTSSDNAACLLDIPYADRDKLLTVTFSHLLLFLFWLFFSLLWCSRNWLICYWASIHHLKATDVPFSIKRRMINNDSNLNWKRQYGLQTFFNRGQERQSEKHNELPLLCPSEPGITHLSYSHTAPSIIPPFTPMYVLLCPSSSITLPFCLLSCPWWP